MANFLENFRAITRSPALVSGQLPAWAPINKLRETINSKEKEKIEAFSNALRSGEIKGSKEYIDNEIDTLRSMDNLYFDFSVDFQKDFYSKHYGDPDELSNDEITKETAEWLNKRIKDMGLDKKVMANGKTFMENFYKYKYDENLFPDPSEKLKWRKSNDPDYYVTGLRFEKIFPFKITPTGTSTAPKANPFRAI